MNEGSFKMPFSFFLYDTIFLKNSLLVCFGQGGNF